MKRSIRLVAGLGLAAGLALGVSPAAQAGEQHHKKTCHSSCTPAPVAPEGGWPCQRDHSCRKPTKPHCPPVKHPHKPVVPPSTVTPHRPVVSKPRTPAPATPATPVRYATPAAPQTVSPSLPRTGGFYEPGLYGAAGLMLVGGGLRFAGRGSKWTKA